MEQPDADMAAVLCRIAELRAGQADRYALPFPAARAQLLAERRWWIDGAPAMRSVDDFVVDTGPRRIRCRRYLPSDAQAESPAAGTELVYLHGGGWCVGSIDTHDGIMRALAQACRWPVTGIDYALAPEHPYPAATEDVAEVLGQLRATHGRATRWVLAGDSAGANLAVGEAIRARDAGEPMPDALLLFYGIFYPLRDSASMRQFGDGRFGLSRRVLERYDAAYFGPVADPGRTAGSGTAPGELTGADLGGLPPAWLAAAGLDPLRDDSVDLASALGAAGNACTLAVYRATVHGFLSYARMLPAARAAFADAAAFVHRSLGAAGG